MADFDLKESNEEAPKEMIKFSSPVKVIYCPTCTMPIEFCEFGASYEQCLPWIAKKHPEVLSEADLAEALGKCTIEGGDEADEDSKDKKSKIRHKGAAALKTAVVFDTKVVIARIQRQKRKYVTVVAGLETVPDLRLKDATKVFGKKFSSGASVNEVQGGGKEVVIQGDVSFDLPAVLMSEFKVAASAIYFLEDGALRPYE
jgi:density-regulated protein DRP1